MLLSTAKTYFSTVIIVAAILDEENAARSGTLSIKDILDRKIFSKVNKIKKPKCCGPFPSSACVIFKDSMNPRKLFLY